MGIHSVPWRACSRALDHVVGLRPFPCTPGPLFIPRCAQSPHLPPYAKVRAYRVVRLHLSAICSLSQLFFYHTRRRAVLQGFELWPSSFPDPRDDVAPWIRPLFGTATYGIFSFYLLACVLKGCMKVATAISYCVSAPSHGAAPLLRFAASYHARWVFASSGYRSIQCASARR